MTRSASLLALSIALLPAPALAQAEAPSAPTATAQDDNDHHDHADEIVVTGIRRRAGDVWGLLREMADPGRSVVELRPGDKQDPIADYGRLALETGWHPAIPLDATIADTWSWWQARAAKPARK